VVVSDQKELEKVKKDLDNGLMGEVLDFDDFYENPNNGYRAYHFIVLFKGTPIEVQLKTKMQKQLNEVSHEFYKKGTLNAKGLNEVSEMIMKADKGDKKALEEVKMLLSNESELAKRISVESFAMGGSLDNHGLKQGDQIIKTMSGGVQKVKTKSGDVVYVNLADGYRGSEPPLPFAKGGSLGEELMGGQSNATLKPSGYHLVSAKGREIIVSDDGGNSKERWVKNNGFSGYRLVYKGNDYEFTDSFDNGGETKRNLSRDRKFKNYSQDHEVRYSKDKSNRKGYGYANGGMMDDDNQMPKLNLGKHKND
jgi:hypothetical protein